MPVRKRTAEGWNFSPDVLGYERNSDGDIVKVVCKVCFKAYINSRPGTSANFNETQKDIFVIGTETVKKNNFTKHIKESKTHAAAVTNVAAKSNDENQLFLMKLAPEGKLKFRTMSLEGSENTDAVGLKKANR